MKYDFLERGARANCIKDYEDFFYVLKKHLGGVVQQKYVGYFLNHTSEIMSMMCGLGLLKRVYLRGMMVYQLQYSNELSSRNVGKITKDMLIRSALRMEHYKSLGLKTFAEIRKHGTYGNNLSANINKEILERYDYNLNKKGILIENLTSPENVSTLYKLKSQNIFIDGIRVKDRVIRPQISIYNINGMLVWNTQKSGVSNMFKSFPITWNLTNNSGGKVPGGVYLYRATISTDGEHFSTTSRKLLVAPKR